MNVRYHNFNDADSLWPTTLHLPACPLKLIYLDLNHWIELSKTHSEHQDGKKHKYVLDACIKAVHEGRAVFPISEYIYAEILKIKNHRQRRDLREVIEQVGRYMVIASLTDVATHEIEAVLDQMVGSNPAPINTMNYLDWGVHRAFGRVGDIRIKSASGDDITEEFRLKFPHGPEAFDTVLRNAQFLFNRQVIDGPTPQEEAEFREQGWNPEAILQVYEQQASQELEQVRRFDEYPKWRRGRVRDVIIARQLVLEHGDNFVEGFELRGINAQDQLSAMTRDDILSIYSGMPSSNVAVTLKASLHRDSNHKWKNNDIYDIRALSLTIPYCDVVVTDSAMWSHVTRHKLGERYNTVVISRLSELLDHIEVR